MTVAKRMCLLLLLNVVTYVLSSVTSTSSPPSSPSPSPSASSGAVAEHDDISVNEEVGGDGRAFYYYNGTAMVNTTTVAITLAFYSVIALGIYSLVAGAAAEQMADFVEVSQVEDVFKVAADAVVNGIDIEREDKESILGDFTGPQDGYSSYQVKKKYKSEYEDYFEDYEAWGAGQGSTANQDTITEKRASAFGPPLIKYPTD